MSFIRVLAVVGFLGAVGVGITGGLMPGVDQPYEFCGGVTLGHPETEIRVVTGTVTASKLTNPCVGQPSYQVLTVVDGENEFEVVLGRQDVIAATDLKFAQGDAFSGRAAVTDASLTAVDVDFAGDVVVLWEGASTQETDEDLAH